MTHWCLRRSRLLLFSPQMEVAFVVYLARRSRAGSAALCCVRLTSATAVGGWFLRSALHEEHLQTGGGSLRAAAQAALLLALWAACTIEGELRGTAVSLSYSCCTCPASALRACGGLQEPLTCAHACIAFMCRCAVAVVPAHGPPGSAAARGTRGAQVVQCAVHCNRPHGGLHQRRPTAGPAACCHGEMPYHNESHMHRW